MGASIYAMSDMHGDLRAFDEALKLVDLSDPGSRLVLCGDYVDHARSALGVCERIIALQEHFPEQVVALMGNNEASWLEDEDDGGAPCLPPHVRRWMRRLPLFYETPQQVFVHAGVDEEAGEWWKLGTEDYYFFSKFPATFGSFVKDVVAGHVGTVSMCGEPRVYWDGESHFYLDGSTEVTHHVPTLRYDLERRTYTTFSRGADGTWAEHPVERG